MENIEAQKEELIALQSIYDEKEFKVDSMDPPSGIFFSNIVLPQPFYVILKNESSKHPADACQNTQNDIIELEHLPPINLFFVFPNTYPSHTCPAFLLSCKWLSIENLSKICKHLEALWIESCNEVILFRWIQFLKEELLEFLQISDSLDLSELINFKMRSNFCKGLPKSVTSSSKDAKTQELSSEYENDINANKDNISVIQSVFQSIGPSVDGGSGAFDNRAFVDLHDGKILKSILMEFNMFKKAEIFQNTWHSCEICFFEKMGCDFTTFKVCNHSFCSQCLKSYFEVQIRDGNIHSLNCPHDKCATQADGSMVKKIVNEELFEKYDAQLLSCTLESMTDIAYCPRLACQCPLVLEACGRMGICPACNFAFCAFCKMAYHGVAPCNFKSEQKKQICEEYLNGNPSTKTELEKRYGKRVIKALVENTLSETWITSYSKNCPHCNSSIEKNDGCNKMTCFRCGTFFCWLCMKQLKQSNPYSHYQERSSECYDQLFPEEFLEEDFYEFEPGEFLDI